MKKGLKKLTAVVLTAAMALSIGMPAFASENISLNSNITMERANAISSELEQQYGVELKVPEKIDIVMTEEEFRMRTELLAIMGAHMDSPSNDLLEKRDKLVKELAEKYPERNTAATTTEENEVSPVSPMYDFYTKTISKNTSYVKITTDAVYTINSSGVKLFVGVDDVDTDIRATVLPEWGSNYIFEKTPGSTSEFTLQTAGASMLVKIYGEVLDINTDIALTSRPQTVNYNNTQL